MHVMIVACYHPLPLSVGHVMFLKGLIVAAFKSSELLHLLSLNGRVGAIPT